MLTGPKYNKVVELKLTEGRKSTEHSSLSPSPSPSLSLSLSLSIMFCRYLWLQSCRIQIWLCSTKTTIIVCIIIILTLPSLLSLFSPLLFTHLSSPLSLLSPITPTGRGRWPPILSLVLLESPKCLEVMYGMIWPDSNKTCNGVKR